MCHLGAWLGSPEACGTRLLGCMDHGSSEILVYGSEMLIHGDAPSLGCSVLGSRRDQVRMTSPMAPMTSSVTAAKSSYWHYK